LRMNRLTPNLWHNALHGMALWLMLLPFAALSLLAPGVMPGRAADGKVVLVLCTPDGPQEMSVDLGGPTPDHPTDPRCAWAQAHVVADLGLGTSFPILAGRVTRAAPATSYQSFRPAHDPRGIFARGPPVFL
jgi:hypothetical protein